MIIPYSNFSILQVGCGGTGGYLVPKIARLLMTLQKYRDGWQGYNIVDFDVVEEINLYRQNFVKADLGLYKSEVMAKRYGSHFGVAIGSGTEKAESWEEIFNFFPECNSGPVCRILIGCVDNNRARKVMHEAFINSDKPIIYIDSGNGKYTGR
ncbi:ThiF family adenylyltransferase [Syntrophomonas palmitatica]|uniref:ThiF family adenylyltransferase n=1 Tax=Syntrophomonas palmitatica TaxID=402877 RepID=UPI0006CF9977|nr:ThiF family adenylyltransferase [Syntrophomonas palmitatica]